MIWQATHFILTIHLNAFHACKYIKRIVKTWYNPPGRPDRTCWTPLENLLCWTTAEAVSMSEGRERPAVLLCFTVWGTVSLKASCGERPSSALLSPCVHQHTQAGYPSTSKYVTAKVGQQYSKRYTYHPCLKVCMGRSGYKPRTLFFLINHRCLRSLFLTYIMLVIVGLGYIVNN